MNSTELFHVSLNIFICDKHNILVLQDITEPFPRTLLNKNIYKPMYKHEQKIIQIFVESIGLEGSTFLKMTAKQ